MDSATLKRWVEKQISTLILLGDSPMDAEKIVKAALRQVGPNGDPNSLIEPADAMVIPVISDDDVADARMDWYLDDGIPQRFKRLPDAKTVGVRVSYQVENALRESLADRSTAWIGMHVPCDTAKAIALPGKEPPDILHMTVLYPGKQDEVTLKRLPDLVRAWAQQAQPIKAQISGLGRFNDGEDADAFYASVDGPGLPAFRQSLEAFLKTNGVSWVDDHGFSPHITLAWLPKSARNPMQTIKPIDVAFDKLTLSIGDVRTDYVLGDQAIINVQEEGNANSGHRGHRGIPGQRGGSLPSSGWSVAGGMTMTLDDLQQWAKDTIPGIPFKIDKLNKDEQQQVLAAFHDVAVNCPGLELPASGVWAFDPSITPEVTRYSRPNPIDKTGSRVDIAVGQIKELDPKVLAAEIERVAKVRADVVTWGNETDIAKTDKKLAYLKGMLETATKQPGPNEKAQHMAAAVPYSRALYATTIHELGHHWHFTKHMNALPELTTGSSFSVDTDWSSKGKAWKDANLQRLSVRSEDRIEEMWAESFLARAIGQGSRVPTDVAKLMDEDGLWIR